MSFFTKTDLAYSFRENCWGHAFTDKKELVNKAEKNKTGTNTTLMSVLVIVPYNHEWATTFLWSTAQVRASKAYSFMPFQRQPKTILSGK